MEENIQNPQINNDSTIKAIAGDTPQGPQYLEHLDKISHSAKMVYYMLISRFLVLVTILSMTFLVLSSLVLFRMAPRVTVEPLLLVKNTSSNDLISHEPIAFNMPSRDALMKMYIRQYIMLRNTIIHDQTEMQTRWMAGGMVHFLSSPEVYNEFGASTAKNWKQIISQPLTREVEIVSMSKQGGNNSPTWVVDFKTYDLPNVKGTRASAENVDSKFWTTAITAMFIPERSFSFNRLINPLGFTVVRYSQTDKY